VAGNQMARGLGFYKSDWFKVKEDKDLVYENIIRILMTAPNERVMRPSFGVGLNRSTFEVITPDVLQDIAILIHNKIQTFEPKVRVRDVQTRLGEQRDVIKIHVFMDYIDESMETETTDELILNYNL
jgi:phage baseplate assembly protein W